MCIYSNIVHNKILSVCRWMHVDSLRTRIYYMIITCSRWYNTVSIRIVVWIPYDCGPMPFQRVSFGAATIQSTASPDDRRSPVALGSVTYSCSANVRSSSANWRAVNVNRTDPDTVQSKPGPAAFVASSLKWPQSAQHCPKQSVRIEIRMRYGAICRGIRVVFDAVGLTTAVGR